MGKVSLAFSAARALAGRVPPIVWQVLAAALIAFLAYLWAFNRGEKAGRSASDAQWQVKVAATSRAYMRAAAEAEKARFERDQAIRISAQKSHSERIRYYEARPVERAAVCLPAERVQQVQSARDAITAAGIGG